MSTMNISLPDAMKDFVDEQVAQKGYGSCSEYVRDLIRKEQDREKLRALLLEGLQSGPGRVVDAAYFDELRARVRRHAAAGKAEQPATARAKRASKAAN
jgi:antitoxin ParD1/3/4